MTSKTSLVGVTVQWYIQQTDRNPPRCIYFLFHGTHTYVNGPSEFRTMQISNATNSKNRYAGKMCRKLQVMNVA